jgi:DNA-binding NarL/FixJ family response regulator
VNEEFSELADKVASLTPSQYKVLCYMRDGLLNKQIGFNLDIAEATVKAHVTAIFKIKRKMLLPFKLDNNTFSFLDLI